MYRYESQRNVNPHVSVDCVLFGYDGELLKVLLVRQLNKSERDKPCRMKLPGSLIYDDEDLDEAAERVLFELTGVRGIKLIQFQAFGSKSRTANPKDTLWLERFHELNTTIDRIVTVAYIALVKIDSKLKKLSSCYNARWLSLGEVGDLAFDHNQIISCAGTYLQKYIEATPVALYDLLPHKFTMQQLRHLNELLFDKCFDPRNFQKKIVQMDYIIALDEYEKDVNHRAARYYKFNRKVYNKRMRKIF